MTSSPPPGTRSTPTAPTSAPRSARLYGAAAKDQFNQIWSAHNGFFVDYTTGVATKDQAKMDKAVQDLTTVYLPQFTDFLAGATDLPKDALTALIKEHVLTTKAIVDAQGTKDFRRPPPPTGWPDSTWR